MSLRGAWRVVCLGALALVAAACGELGEADDETRGVATTTSVIASGGVLEPLTPRVRVTMIGDSITFLAAEPLRAALSGAGLEVLAIDAQVGRRITVGTSGRPFPGADVVEFAANTNPPDVWVIALGTNDIGQYAAATELAAQVAELLDRLPPSAPLVWVDTWDGTRPDATRFVNDTLRAMLAGRDATAVVDWSSHGDDVGVVSNDGVHPTEVGTRVFGEVVAEGVTDLLSSL